MASPQVPGFIACFFDIPFPTSVPNGTYVARDPVKGLAAVTLTLREGTRTFFRNVPIEGPTSFEQLRKAQQEPPRPRQNHSYLAVNKLHDGGQKSTLSVNSGVDGDTQNASIFLRSASPSSQRTSLRCRKEMLFSAESATY